MSARSRRRTLGGLLVAGLLGACAGGCTIETAEASTDTTPFKEAAVAPATEAEPACRNLLGAPCAADVAEAADVPSEGACRQRSVTVSVDSKVTPGGGSMKVVHASIDEECFEGGASSKVATSPAPSSSTSASTVGVSAYVLASIPYRDCGSGGSGSVDVTFDTTGSVANVDVHGGWNGTVKACIAQRFGAAHVPAFTGASRTVQWPVTLPDSGGWGS